MAHGEPFAGCLALAAASPKVLAAGLNCCAPALALGWVRAGARLVGGCCRTGPAETRAIRAALLGAPER